MRQYICAGLALAVAVILSSDANAQARDCRSISDPAERLRCFDQPKDCKTITDAAERLKCFDAQTPAAPGASPAAVAPPAPAPAPPPAPEPAQRILKAEPPGGQLPAGAKVWIDDGSCPAGFIKQVVGGDVSIGQARERSCVARR